MTTYIDGKAVGIGTIRAEIGVSGNVLHDSTLKGNGNTEPLGVDTEVIATTNQVGNLATTLTAAIQETREDYIQADSELQTHITEQAEDIAKKQDKLVAGDNIVISGNVISATGGGVSLPDQTGNYGKFLITDGNTVSWTDTLSQLILLTTNTFGTPIFSLSAGGQYNWTFYVQQTGLELHYGGYQNNVLKFPTTGGTLARMEDLQSATTTLNATIAGKQDKLTAGDNITIEDGVISAAGGGASGDFLPLSGGTITGKLLIDVGESPTTVGATRTLGFTGTVDGVEKTCWLSYMPQYYRLDVGNVYIYNTGNITPHGDGEKNIGSAYNKFNTVYTNQISSSASEAIIIPALSGTMARTEDIQAIGGDGTEGQVLTKTVDGFEWKDASGGGGDFLPLSGGTVSGDVVVSGQFKVGRAIFKEQYNILNITPWSGMSYYQLSSSYFRGTGSEQTLGGGGNFWKNVYTKKLNNGEDIAVPTSGGTMVVATPPTEDGSYVLKCVITNGVPTVSWVKE